MRRFLRRATRWAFNGLAIMSLLLCVATCVMWARSYWTRDGWAWGRTTPDRRDYTLSLNRGRLRLDWFEYGSREVADEIDLLGRGDSGDLSVRHETGQPFIESADPSNTLAQRLGFGTDDWQPLGQAALVDEHIRAIPLWSVALVTGSVAGWWLVSIFVWRRRRDRLRRGQCPVCGYDRRATPDGSRHFDRCPECGTAVGKGTT